MTTKSLLNETMYMSDCISFIFIAPGELANIQRVVHGETFVSSLICSRGEYSQFSSTLTKSSALLTFDFDEHWPTCASTKSVYWRNQKNNSKVSTSSSKNLLVRTESLFIGKMISSIRRWLCAPNDWMLSSHRKTDIDQLRKIQSIAPWRHRQQALLETVKEFHVVSFLNLFFMHQLHTIDCRST